MRLGEVVYHQARGSTNSGNKDAVRCHTRVHGLHARVPTISLFQSARELVGPHSIVLFRQQGEREIVFVNVGRTRPRAKPSWCPIANNHSVARNKCLSMQKPTAINFYYHRVSDVVFCAGLTPHSLLPYIVTVWLVNGFDLRVEAV